MIDVKDWPLMLNVNQVAQLTGLPISQLRKWLMKPEQMPFNRIGGRWYVNKHKLLDWLESDLSELYVP